MQSILVFSACLVLVHGRPEPPSGYNYPAPPSSRYGAPSGGQGQGDFRSSGGQSGLGGGSGLGSGSGSSFAGSFSPATGSAGAVSGSFTSGSSSSGASISGQASTGARQSGSSSSTRSSSEGQIIVNKHVYVHVAPPELEEEAQAKATVRLPTPQKNYKIIFIKAPSLGGSQKVKIPPIPQNEEKTLVYVLVKKPEDQGEIVIPTAAPSEPSKPEVYFIRYKTQTESGGQGQGATGDESLSDNDTVEVVAGERGAGASQGDSAQGSSGSAQGNANFGQGGAGSSQGGAGGYSYSSSRSSSSSVSSQYGAPNSSGPY